MRNMAISGARADAHRQARTATRAAGPLSAPILRRAVAWLAGPTPPDGDPSIAHLRRPQKLLLSSLIVIGVAIAVATAVIVTHFHERAITGATRDLRSLALIVSEQANEALHAIEITELALLEQLRNDGVRSPADFRQALATPAMHERLVRIAHALPQLDAILAIDVEGNLVNFSRAWPIPDLNLADRDYFRALTADPELMMYISEAVQNRSTGTWTIYVAHKAVAADGTLLGIILGAVQLSYFEQFYRAVAPAAPGSLSLFRKDGILLVRYPREDPDIGRSFASNPVFKPLVDSGQDSVVVRFPGLIDGRDRLVAARTLARFALVAAAGSSIEAILGEWRANTAYLIGVAVILEMMVAGLGLLMLGQLRDHRMLSEARTARSEAEAELVLAREKDQASRALTTQHMLLGAAMSNMSQALGMFDSSNHLIVANRRLAEVFGVPRSTVQPGTTLDALQALISSESNLTLSDVDLMFDQVLAFRHARKRGSRIIELADHRTLAVNFAPLDDDGWLVTLEDISEQRVAAARISHMALHDALTGLPNRVLFHIKLGEAVARSLRGVSSAILYLDLDHFKTVNDTLGHPVGDALLREVTRRLAGQVRETDTVARLGGDEFAIVQSSVDQPDDATSLASRLIDVLSAPYSVSGHQVVVGTSIGIAVLPGDGDDPDLLLKNADLALYRAKEEGRGRYRFFEPEMDARMQARRALELDLRKALANGEFEVFYQPLINIQTRSITGFEALVRWHHPERGLVQPNDFVSMAEEMGLIVPLGKFVLRQACVDAVGWPGSPKVAVNLSPVQFGSGTLVADVAAALRDSGLSPKRLELEITESVMLDDTDAVLVILYQLRTLGVGIAMDDFGTGYSSLSYLRRFPFSKVKIDQSFVRGLGQGGDCDTIVAAVADLCTRLGMTTTAEGVETEDQMQRLRAGNCTEAQGYLFSEAIPADRVMALFAELQDQRISVET
jgi:diguanylate cyclase (GGDEF)-like protein